MSNDLYALLGVRPSVPMGVIRQAYRQLAKTAHPDVGGSEERFAAIKRAHDVLTDPERRKRYDETGQIEEVQPDNEMAEVFQVIAGLLNSVLGSQRDPTTADLVMAMKDQIGTHMANAREQIAGLSMQASRADDLAKRFRVKKKGAANHLAGILGAQAAQMRQGIKNIEHAIETHRKALKALDDYVFDAKVQQHGFIQLRTGSASATGTAADSFFRVG